MSVLPHASMQLSLATAPISLEKDYTRSVGKYRMVVEGPAQSGLQLHESIDDKMPQNVRVKSK
jgi:hypothetical protein